MQLACSTSYPLHTARWGWGCLAHQHCPCLQVRRSARVPLRAFTALAQTLSSSLSRLRHSLKRCWVTASLLLPFCTGSRLSPLQDSEQLSPSALSFRSAFSGSCSAASMLLFLHCEASSSTSCLLTHANEQTVSALLGRTALALRHPEVTRFSPSAAGGDSRTHIGERVDAIWPDCPAALGDFVPDGIIISYSHPLSKFPSRVVIVEFAQCYTSELLVTHNIFLSKCLWGIM
eukprot:2125072-Rhodomonas_salina.3